MLDFGAVGYLNSNQNLRVFGVKSATVGCAALVALAACANGNSDPMLPHIPSVSPAEAALARMGVEEALQQLAEATDDRVARELLTPHFAALEAALRSRNDAAAAGALRSADRVLAYLSRARGGDTPRIASIRASLATAHDVIDGAPESRNH